MDSDQLQLLFQPADLPNKLGAIEGLDFSDQLTVDPMGSDWFRLGVRSLPGLDVSAHQSRECFLIPVDEIPRTFGIVDNIGEALDGLGQPASWLTTEPSGESSYAYHPAHSFELRHSGFFVEPLTAERRGTVGESTFLINPDLWLHLGLEESSAGSGVWWNHASGMEVLRLRQIPDAQLEVVEIRRDALLRYLRDRQRALVVGDFRSARRDRPSAEDLAVFDTVDIVLEREGPYRAKVILRSNGPGAGITPETRKSLYRWLHLWFCILPPALNTTRPFDEQPSFDVYAFTLPTHAGEAAPWRYRGSAANPERPFAGAIVDHMTPVYFRQGVLEKYQDSATYRVEDDGGVHCGHFWSTGPSTRRIANEFVAVPIGDFGIGVPFDDWPHWKQFAVPPPSHETLEVAHSEPAIVSMVNDLAEELHTLDRAFQVACFNHGIEGDQLWEGSLDTPAGRNLKRYYRDDAHDDEFLERATFAATLTLDELRAKPLQAFLRSFDPTLHLSFDAQLPLRSFNLLQRVALVVRIVAEMHPQRETIGRLVRAAEGYGEPGLDPQLVRDLQAIRDDVRGRLAPLAFLADLRNTAGVAHRPASPQTIGAIVAKFGLPNRGWKRRDYHVLLKTVSASIAATSSLLTTR